MTETGPILVVGDDVVQPQLIKVALAAAGWRVIQTDDGFEALRIVREDLPSVLVLDINLSRPNAVELLRALHPELDRGELRVVGIIQPGESDLQDRCSDLGVQTFVYEPIDLGDVTEWVKALDAGRGSR